MSTATAKALKDLAEAAQLFASATEVLSAGDLPAGHAAFFALLTEHLAQQQTRAQIQAAHALRRTGAHKLDRASFQAITDAGTNPTIEQIEAAAGHTTAGRTHFKKPLDVLANWLNLLLSRALDRLNQVDNLMAQINGAGERRNPRLPALAW
ncbi:hypothetical protein [Glutamicibacter sp. NPDC127525]|uniref:hypothetical protein n=1 Tax=unclassified Glutamicibacter TaxID=2627139 RepID=UPI0036412630